METKEIITILQKPSNKRTEEDLDKIIPYMQEVQFFIEREIKEHDFPDIIDALKYEQYNNDDIIFHWGDLGDKFYILI